MTMLKKMLLALTAACALFVPAVYAADLSQTATSVVGYGERAQGTLGGTVTAGMPVRRQTDGSWIASTNASAAGSEVHGVALSGGATGQPFTYQLPSGNINLGGTLSVGKIYVLSAAGAISPVDDVATSDYMTVICIAISTSLCKLGIVNSGGIQAAADVT